MNPPCFRCCADFANGAWGLPGRAKVSKTKGPDVIIGIRRAVVRRRHWRTKAAGPSLAVCVGAPRLIEP